LQKEGCHTLPVVENGRLVGMITADNLAEVLMIQEALGHNRRPRRDAEEYEPVTPVEPWYAPVGRLNSRHGLKA
jgi:hypothetical protein